ncbi:hypothetical protein KBY66_11110 [Synechococcus sp. Tobar12-5m-g]|uniref:hypothetical protein n=1 Tax=unclassified Synechococcus TaxID=2626047 RepID=UPI0020CCB7E2|nr:MULTISPECIES: hypothetical protein [unclassified Synechococcus]MCP9773171.1 hypothetical protein [Synechococcus sp. Tobar12-5m-g]MCP9874077.1 hypothetical protein [Synechococcus sp. Cruz CV-v-12]
MIACHRSCTFHFRYSPDRFCQELGLVVEGASPGGHVVFCRRACFLDPNWSGLRRMERRSRLAFPLKEWKRHHLLALATAVKRIDKSSLKTANFNEFLKFNSFSSSRLERLLPALRCTVLQNGAIYFVQWIISGYELVITSLKPSYSHSLDICVDNLSPKELVGRIWL